MILQPLPVVHCAFYRATAQTEQSSHILRRTMHTWCNQWLSEKWQQESGNPVCATRSGLSMQTILVEFRKVALFKDSKKATRSEMKASK
jgi:ribonuclease HI